ncbi:MAG: hypothetical protein IKO75_12420 [Bacteroidales bacterium]|nr:hypothetical protein [Bacteroidales bacterium]
MNVGSAGHFSAKRTGGGSSVIYGVDYHAVTISTEIAERAFAVTHRQPARANLTEQLTAIPFGHPTLSKTLARADNIASSWSYHRLPLPICQ